MLGETELKSISLFLKTKIMDNYLSRFFPDESDLPVYPGLIPIGSLGLHPGQRLLALGAVEVSDLGAREGFHQLGHEVLPAGFAHHSHPVEIIGVFDVEFQVFPGRRSSQPSKSAISQ